MRLTQQHFDDLFEAAHFAKEAGEEDLAGRLDVMARKANAEVTNAGLRIQGVPPMKWRDCPSVFSVYGEKG